MQFNTKFEIQGVEYSTLSWTDMRKIKVKILKYMTGFSQMLIYRDINIAIYDWDFHRCCFLACSMAPYDASISHHMELKKGHVGIIPL